MVHDPALAAGVVVGAPVSPPGMGPGVGAQPGPQPSVGIIRSLCGRGVALGGSAFDQPTRTPPADVEDSTQVNNGSRAGGRQNFLGDLAEHVFVQLGISKQVFEPLILGTQLLQLLGVLGFQPAELVTPPKVGLLGDTELPGNLAVSAPRPATGRPRPTCARPAQACVASR